MPSRARVERVLRYVLDENEFLSPHGVRSLSRIYKDKPYVLALGGRPYEIRYAPAEADSAIFGGNSNWRGPVWMPLNYLLIETLKRHHHFYRESFRVECLSGSGKRLMLLEVAQELERRIAGLFLADDTGRRPCLGDARIHRTHPDGGDLLLFHEYFDGDTGRGLGASRVPEPLDCAGCQCPGACRRRTLREEEVIASPSCRNVAPIDLIRGRPCRVLRGVYAGASLSAAALPTPARSQGSSRGSGP